MALEVAVEDAVVVREDDADADCDDEAELVTDAETVVERVDDGVVLADEVPEDVIVDDAVVLSLWDTEVDAVDVAEVVTVVRVHSSNFPRTCAPISLFSIASVLSGHPPVASQRPLYVHVKKRGEAGSRLHDAIARLMVSTARSQSGLMRLTNRAE